MDRHPGRTPAASRDIDPDAYEQGYSDGYSGRNAGRFVHTSNVSANQAGYVDGECNRRSRAASGNDCAGEEEAGLHSEARGQAYRAVCHGLRIGMVAVLYRTRGTCNERSARAVSVAGAGWEAGGSAALH